MAARLEHSRLDAEPAEHSRGIDQRRIFEVGEDGIVARAPRDSLDGLVQPLGGMREKSHPRGLHPQHPGDARLRALVDDEELIAPGHARALESAHARGGLIVRAEPRGLSA